MHTCNSCGLGPSETTFHKCKSRPSGLQPRCVACAKRSRKANWAKHYKSQQDWKRKNRSRVLATARANYAKKPEAWQARSRKWRAENPEKQKQATKSWKQRNHSRVISLNNHRRAKLAKAVGRFTDQEWLARCNEYGRRCAYCRKARPLTRHHLVPLSRGGNNLIENILPACRSCNSRVGTKIVYPEKLPC